MKKNFIYTIIGACLFLCISGCEQIVLNLEDPGSPTDATFFQTEPQLEVALAGIYQSLNFVRIVPFPQLLDHTTDYAFNRGNVGGTVPTTNGGLTSTEAIINAYWNRFYGGIQRANNLLTNMDRAKEVANPTRFEEIRGEALALRAIFYSYLVELYGDVPFRTDVATTLDNLAVPKTSKSEIVSSIIADLQAAADILPVTQSSGNRGRVSANAANAMIARIALYNGDYALAESAALKVMNSGEASLFSDYESLFTTAGVGSPEVLLDLSFTDGTNTHQLPQRLGTRFGGWCQLVPAQQTVDSYETINGLPINEDPAYDPANPFENRDPRLKATIVVPGEEWTGHIIQTHSDSIATWRVENGVNVERVFNPNAANPGGRKIIDPYDGTEYTAGGANRFVSFTGYFWKKFADEPALVEGGGAQRRSELPVYLIRYAEVLLTYAEARIEGGKIDNSVLDAINQIRERAYNGSGVPYPAISTTNQDELRRIVRRERKIELTNEGLRLFDIRRWGIAKKVLNTVLFGSPANGFSMIGGQLGFVPSIDEDGFVTYPGAPSEPRKELGDLNYRELETRVFDDRHYLWPIPQAEIDATDGLVSQNPGY